MLLKVVGERVLAADPFVLVDVGCALGIDPVWRLFGDDLRAYGFDPQVDECRRLAEAEQNPHVSYHAAFVGLPDDHPFHEQRSREAAATAAYFDPITRSSAYAAIARRGPAGAGTASSPQEAADEWERQLLSTEKIGVSEFVRRSALASVDFVKVDTQGADLEVAISADDAIRDVGILGFLIETWYTGSHHETANSFHNVDRLMKRHGFLLFDVTMNRYSRAVLPAPFVYRAPYQTTTGQPIWGDVLYLRDAGAPDYADVWGDELSPSKLLKLACLLELFRLPDCAVELILHHRTTLETVVDPDELLDLLTPPLRGGTVTYDEYVAAFESDTESFFPMDPAPAADERQVRAAAATDTGRSLGAWGRLARALKARD